MNSTTVDRYGVKADDIRLTKKFIENILKIKFELHSSTYVGDYYCCENEIEKYVLQKNYHEVEGWTLEDHKDAVLVLKITDSPRANEIRELLLSQVEMKFFFVERAVAITGRIQRYHYINGKDELFLDRQMSSSYAIDQ